MPIMDDGGDTGGHFLRVWREYIEKYDCQADAAADGVGRDTRGIAGEVQLDRGRHNHRELNGGAEDDCGVEILRLDSGVSRSEGIFAGVAAGERADGGAGTSRWQ